MVGIQVNSRREVSPASPVNRRALKRELANAGFTRTFGARYRGRLVITAVALSVIALLTLAQIFPQLFSAPDSIHAAVTGVLGLGALYLGLQQWSAARSELSLDKFYEKLAATNRKLDEYHGAREFAGPWSDSSEGDEDLAYERKMYVYLELDNLEYAIAKYNLGYMASSDAYRSLRTFRQRCHASSEFCRLASTCVETNEGYNWATKKAVKSSIPYSDCVLGDETSECQPDTASPNMSNG